MTRPCTDPVPFGTLAGYWLGELAAEDERAVEEHFFGCAHCSDALAELAKLGRGVRMAFERGALRAVISAAFLESMKARGMRLREYRVAPGGSVHCTIAAGDDAVVGRMKAPLAGVERVDLVGRTESGAIRIRLRDIPFDPASGEVIYCPAASGLKAMPAHTDRIELVAVGPGGERPLGDYTFIHAPG